MACYEGNLSGLTANYTFGFDEPIANQPVVISGVGDVQATGQGGGKRKKRKSTKRKSTKRKSRSRTKSRRSKSRSKSRSKKTRRRRR